ncbi:MAG: putative ABC transporter permease [Acutalibacteraceae bacterium]
MISEAKTKVPEQPAADKQDNLPESNGNNKKIKPNKLKKSFASGINFYKLVWIFLIGSFLGVVCEVIFCLIVDHRYESRQGVIYGPFNPVYGVGVVLVTVCLYWLRNKRDFWTFLCGSFIGAASEYLCSWYQETFIGTVSWDYSNMWGNLNGRTCLLYAGIWGFLAMLWMKFIYPWVSKLVEAIPNKVGYPLTWILLIAMLVNIWISSVAVNRMTARHQGVEPQNAFDEFLDDTYPDDFLISVYNHMQYASDGVETDAYTASKESK